MLFDGARHTPIANLAPELRERTITLQSPSKAFNLPGLSFSFAVVQDEVLRLRYQAFQGGRLPHTNAFGLAAALAAYRDSQEWLAANLAYLRENRDFAFDYLSDCLPQLSLTRAGRHIYALARFRLVAAAGWAKAARILRRKSTRFAERRLVWRGRCGLRAPDPSPRRAPSCRMGLERMRAAVEGLLS